MAGPQDFFMPTAPGAYAAPLLDFGKIADDFYKSRSMNAFAGGIPLDAHGKPDTQEMLKRTVQFGGLPAAQALLPYMVNSDQAEGDAAVIENANRAARGLPPLPPAGVAGAPQQGAAPGASGASGASVSAARPPPAPAQYAKLYQDTEDKYGLPAGYMATTAGLESSHNPRAYNELSHAAGQFQFIPSTARQYGLKNPFDPVASADAAGRLASDNAAALKAAGLPVTAGTLYLAHQQGVSGAIKLLTNPNVPAGQLVPPRNIAANGGNPNAPAGAFVQHWAGRFDNNAQPRAIAAHAGSQAGSPAAMGQASGASDRAPVSTGAPQQAAGQSPDERAAAGGAASGRGVAGQPGPVPPPSGGVPQTAGRGGAAIPAPGVIQQEAPASTGPTTEPAPRQPLPPPADPTIGDPTLDNLNKALGTVEQQATRAASLPMDRGKDRAANLQKTADDLRSRIKEREAVLRKQAEETPEERIAHRYGEPLEKYTAGQEIEKARRTAGEQHFGAIQGVETIHNQAIEPYAKAIDAQLNNPNGPWTGIGAHSVLDYNRAKAAVGGNPRAAQMQEAFQKNAAQLKLGIFNLQKMLEKEGGDKATRTFQIQAQNVNKATADFGNTPAGNRYLVEMTLRMGEQYRHIAQMARDYRANPNGPKFLDDKFYEKVDKYLATPRENGGGQLWNELEETNQHLIGAPHAPKNLKTQDELFQWQRGVGLEPGEPYRRPDGSYGCALGGKCK